jgi:DNA recombination protein RmuC
MSQAPGILVHMDALTLSIVVVGCLAAGLLAGSFAGAARATTRAAQTGADLRARLAASEASRQGVQAQLEHQHVLYRELAAQARSDQALREERERREQAVLRALAPVHETLQTMQSKVDDLERDRHAQFGTLAEQLRQAQRSDEALRATTESLASALRSGSTRGVWGETQLRRVVEAAGLTRYIDFDTQTSITSDAGAGRPDMVIRLPGEKAIAVDAKVPLDAYLEASAIPLTAVGAEGARRKALIEKHVKAVRAHIDALARKTYWAGLTSSPEFVVCFMPSESLLSAALEEDPALLDYAFGKRVALASPVNLWAVLKTVAFTWTQQDVSQEARALFALGNELYERLSTLAGHADDVRRAIERTVDSYNRFAGSLESRVLVTARRFPGIDQTKLDALAQPPVIDKTPRRLTASELLDVSLEQDDASSKAARFATHSRERDAEDDPHVTADLGDVRARIAPAGD